MIVLLLLLFAAACFVLAYVSHRNHWQRRVAAPRPRPSVAPTRASVRAHVPHALYVYYWGRGGECYFGISNDPEARDRYHEKNSKWYPFSTMTMHVLCWYPDRATALAAEATIIRRTALAGADLANDKHNPYARRRRAA